MSEGRGRAYRRWKTFTKYVAKLKERMGWYVDDPNAPRGHRHPTSWKELDVDEDNNYVKMLKKTSTKWSSKWEDSVDHIRIKRLRREGKNLIDDELKGEEE
jgi:hypothetical protein